ncbi:MAG: 23S rRNA (guanosine(2251)-2'-O)-methyltransferase RlmB [Acidobacteriota bacterium]|nr:23S rRNA (guanosine(2251)-2'-O)-methyltransferase RlmB [Acidobacteriota bacterium]
MSDRDRDGEEVTLYGVHPVLETLERRPRTVDRVLVARERRGAKLGRLLRVARESGIPVSHVPRKVLDRAVGSGRSHQGVVAVAAAAPYADAERLCRDAGGREDGLLVALDGVQDPRNLGAVIRTAAGAGVHGILLGTEGTVGLTSAAVKTSAGAVERIEVAREPRLAGRLRDLAARGFTAVGLDPKGESEWDRVPMTGRIILVAGGEERGLRRGVAEACDHRVAVPLAPGVDSLNLSVSVGIVLFETVRQRRAARADR